MNLKSTLTISVLLGLMVSCDFKDKSDSDTKFVNLDVAKHLSLTELNETEQEIVCNSKTLFVFVGNAEEMGLYSFSEKFDSNVSNKFYALTI